jgi:thiol-disulfide isomerase/thioredoxin
MIKALVGWAALLLVCVPGPVRAEDELPTEVVKAWKELRDLQKAKPLNPELVEDWSKKLKACADAFLKEHGSKLKTGDGPYYAGRAWFIVENWVESAKAFKEYLDGDPEATFAKQASQSLIQALVSAGKKKEALGAIEEFVKRNPDLPDEHPILVLRASLEGSVEAEVGWDKLKDQTAPELEVTEIIGEGITKDRPLGQLKGKVVLMDFWATWCGPCRMVIPAIVKLQEKYKDQGLVVVGVTRYYGFGWLKDETKQDLIPKEELDLNKEFVREFKMNYPVVFTLEKSQDAYDVKSIPSVFVVDREGKLRFRHIGSGDIEKDLVPEIEKLLAEKASGSAAPAPAPGAPASSEPGKGQ